MKRLLLGLFCAPFGLLALTVAQLLGPRTAMGGTIIFNLMFAAAWAVIFVWAVNLQTFPMADSLLWGAAYGFLGWLVGPLTVGGVISGHGVLWGIAEFSELFPDLIAYLLYGMALGLIYPIIHHVYIERRRVVMPAGWRLTAARGALAGLVVGLIFINRLSHITLLPVPGMNPDAVPLIVHLILSIGVGILLGLVSQHARDSAGAGLIRGMAHGILWWVGVVLTVQPLLSGEAAAWTLPAATARIDSLLGLIVYGGALALFYHLLTRSQETLFSDTAGLGGREEGIGIRNLRALGSGIVGSVLGGLAFTVVMLQTGALPEIAGIVRGSDALTGLIVHFIIAMIIGAQYGVLFSRQAESAVSAIGWGVAYGSFWWVLGPITLLPLLLGQSGTLMQAAARSAYPAALIGHIAYGVVTALYFYLQEKRRGAVRDENGSSAVRGPLWLVITLFLVMIPILLHTP